MADIVTADQCVHPFERAGLGKAPFRFLGVEENVIKHPDGREQAGGCCDYCYTGIRYEFRILSSDGRVSKVGCDCILKLDRADNRLIKQAEAAKLAIERTKRKQREEARKIVEAERIKAAYSRIDDPEVKASMQAKPHPHMPHNPMSSLWHYVAWVGEHGGHSGKLACAKMIENA